MDTQVLWFKRRRYGWGWFPVSWQGWLIIGLFLAVVLVGAAWMPDDSPKNTLTTQGLMYLSTVALSALILIGFSYKHAPSPKWRWGNTPTDNPDQDM